MEPKSSKQTQRAAVDATYAGQKPDQGLIIIGEEFPNEGFAVIKCGGTQVQISYTILSEMLLQLDAKSIFWGDLVSLQKAFHAITCEAALGRTPDF